MKSKVLIVLSALLFAICCSPKLDTGTAGGIIKTTFNLTEKDVVEISGIAKETEDVMLVKFQLNGNEINSRMRKYDKGWKLDEVQNQLGGWVPVATVAGQLDPIEKMKIAREEIKLIAIVLTDYVTDRGIFSFEGSPFLFKESDMYKALCPMYAKSLPSNDPWGKHYWVLCGKNIDGSQYGIPKGAADDFLIFSGGRDGKLEDWVYDPKNEKAGLYKGYDPDKDIVSFNGSFIRAPDTWGF